MEINNTVVFVSSRDLNRAENIKALWSEYYGPKKFIQKYNNKYDELSEKRFRLVITDDFLPGCISPMIMIFHGIAGGKTYGLDSPSHYHRKETARRYLYFITSSKDMVEFTANQCGAEKNKVLPLGMPRTDAYIGKKKGDGGTEWVDKKTYLYVPTFNTYTESFTDWKAVDRMLSDDEILLIKNHPITGKTDLRGEFKHIYQIDPQKITTPYLIDCDVCITDYSSTMFDAYVLKKPVVLYEKDWKTYKNTRGMYFDYPNEYSSRHANTGYEMLRLCREAVGNFKTDKICVKNREKLAGACDGNSTKRIIDLIEKELSNGE